MKLNEIVPKIESKEDFQDFLSLLIADYRENKESWENKSIDSYLLAMKAWIEDMNGYYKNQNKNIPESIDWNTFSNILYASKMYE